jgi:hypothetical protein
MKAGFNIYMDQNDYLLETMIVSKLVTKFLSFVWVPKFDYHVHNGPPLDRILIQFKTVYDLTPYYSKTRSSVISSVSIVSRLWAGRLGVRFFPGAEKRFFLFTTAVSRSVLRPTQPPIHMEQRLVPRG